MSKHIELVSITLTNFMGERNRTTRFDAKETTIMGGNGLGKSRHFKGFLWCFFGKDDLGRKDYEVKTLVDGKELHHVDCEVSATIRVDGVESTFRRCLVEQWVKPRGCAEQVFKGNKGAYFINDVPMKESEYKAKVAEIIDEDVFRMITNPLFFASMDWKKQREQLFALGGAITDSDIASGNEKFTALLDKLTGKSFDDYRKEIAVKKSKAKKELDEIQPRIDQSTRLMPDEKDWGALESEIGKIDAEIEAIDKQIADVAEKERAIHAAESKKRNDIAGLQAKQSHVLFMARKAATDAAYESNAKRRDLQGQIDAESQTIGQLNRALSGYESEVREWQSKIDECARKREKFLQEWQSENARVFEHASVCPTCGQAYPSDMIANAEQLFRDDVKTKKDAINKKGQEVNASRATAESAMSEVNAKIQETNAKIQEHNDILKRLNEQMDAMPEAKAQEPIANELPEWREIQSKIDAINATISTDTTNNVDNSGEIARKKELTATRDELKRQLATREDIERIHQSIDELEERGKTLAETIAGYEGEEMTIAGFTKAKISECEKRINSLFTFVTFRLFDYTIDGNEFETCIPLVDGVPFGAANTAGRINAGLDIINALCRFYEVNAPIFIDGRESINDLLKTESQIINLVVSRDNEIIIK